MAMAAMAVRFPPFRGIRRRAHAATQRCTETRRHPPSRKTTHPVHRAAERA